MFKIRYALVGAAAMGMFLGGTGVAHATGSTGCSSSGYFSQTTSYHGTICYTNTGFDNLSTSGFWTSEIKTGTNTGCFYFIDQDGYRHIVAFGSNARATFSPVVSLVGLDIDSNSGGNAPTWCADYFGWF